MIYIVKVVDIKTCFSGAVCCGITELCIFVDIAICDVGAACAAGAAGGTWVYGVICAVMAGGAVFPYGG